MGGMKVSEIRQHDEVKNKALKFSEMRELVAGMEI